MDNGNYCMTQNKANLIEILKKLNKTENDLSNCKRIIKEWYLKQPHLPTLPMDDLVTDRKLEYNLIHCKFNLEKVKKVVDYYFTVRNLVPELYENWDPLCAENQKALRTSSFLMLPKLTPNLDRVTIIRILDSNPNNFSLWHHSKVAIMYGEIRTVRQYSFREEFIFDLDKVQFGHVMKITPVVLKTIYDTLMQAYALRVAGIHYINSSSYMNTLLAVMKPIFKPKIYKRIHIHANITSLHRMICKDILPLEYGGNEISFNELYEKQIRELEEVKEYLLNDIELRSNEEKRIEKLDDHAFGSIHGTFRKLDID